MEPTVISNYASRQMTEIALQVIVVARGVVVEALGATVVIPGVMAVAFLEDSHPQKTVFQPVS